jgi:hypothetical protein
VEVEEVVVTKGHLALLSEILEETVSVASHHITRLRHTHTSPTPHAALHQRNKITTMAIQTRISILEVSIQATKVVVEVDKQHLPVRPMTVQYPQPREQMACRFFLTLL